MRARLAMAVILLEIAFRNLVASRLRTVVVGGIVLFGAFLVVSGSSCLESIDRGMRRSIQGSISGHLQIYNGRSREDLALYGGMTGDSDLEPMEDYAAVKQALAGVPNVRALVPMGTRGAMVSGGNVFDRVLERLRDDVRRVRAGDAPPETREHVESRKAHLRRMVGLLQQGAAAAREFSEEGDEALREAQDRERALSDEFWAGFDADPEGSLEFLENRIAPQSQDGGFTYIQYIGTDLEAYRRAFEGLEIVEGAMVPAGERGLLLGKLYAENYLKLPVARRLDRIREQRALGARIAKDERLRNWVKENTAQTGDILLQLDPLRAKEATARLQRALGTAEADLAKLLEALLQTDDANFDERYKVFYEQLAPLLDLYMFRVGDVITLKAPTKSGYINSLNLKIHGLVQFKGLEKSNIAGLMSVMDLQSFRDLYGWLTPERAEEIRQLKASAGLREVDRGNAEAELFGGGALEEDGARAEIAEPVFEPRAAPAAEARRPYTQEEMDGGVALNVAVLLDDPARWRATLRDIAAALEKAGLGHLKVVDWQTATGLVGQALTMVRLVLWVAVVVIFLVALVIVNNATLMAMLQRVREIGTMRAIGARPRFVLLMLMVETTATGLAFGALGAALGAGLVALVRARGGIPAFNEDLYMFFGGPALVPVLGGTSLAVALAIVLVVSVLSGLYPAVLAMRTTPLEAMQAED